MNIVFYEDIPPDFTSTSETYTVSEEEIIDFGKRYDPQPFHVDPQAAEQSIFKGLVAPGALVFAIRSWLVNHLSHRPSYLAGLGLENMDLPNPVRPGDTLKLTIECVEKRESRSRPEAGIVSFNNVITNQRGEEVLTMLAKVLVAKTPD
jgi:acyl dehydratase